jgi:hypothetical protein
MFLVGLAYFKTTSSYFLQKIKNTEKLNRITPQMYLSLFVIVLLITTPAILKRSYNHGNYDGRGVQKEYITGMIFIIITLLSYYSSYYYHIILIIIIILLLLSYHYYHISVSDFTYLNTVSGLYSKIISCLTSLLLLILLRSNLGN